MAKVEYIAESEAPRPPRAATKNAQESLAILNGIKAGTVAKLMPDGSKTARGIRASLTRAAKAAGIKIQAYQVEGDPAVYVRRLR